MALLIVLGTLAGCGESGTPGTGLEELSEPVLDRLDPAVRSQLQQGLAAMRDLVADPRSDRMTLGEAYGNLGRLYHTYELFDSAVPAYRNAETLRPHDYRWPYYRGQVHRARSELVAAQQAFERVLELRPGDVPTLVALGQVHHEAGRLDVAERYARQVLTVDNDSGAALLLLAFVAVDAGDPQAAAEWYERILELQPLATQVHQPLAMAYRSLGRMDEAREHLARRGNGRVAASDPLLHELRSLAAGTRRHQDAGAAAFERGDFAGAVEAFRSALRADPQLVAARLNLGSALAQLGRLDEAREQYQEVVRLEPEHAMAQFNLGVILDKLGKPDESIEHYEQALRIDPGYVEARFNLANSLRRTGGCPAALGHYDRLRQAAPGNSSVRVGEALCLIETGQHDRARVRLNEGLGALPDDPLMVSISARLFAASPQDDLRDGERAVGLAQGLVGRQRSAGVLETLAMALAEVGRFEEAVEKQLEAIALSEKVGSAELRKRLHGNLERYSRGEPCRDPAVR